MTLFSTRFTMSRHSLFMVTIKEMGQPICESATLNHPLLLHQQHLVTIMCILITVVSPRGCCRKELVVRCHLDQFSEFLYAKAGRVLADKCPKTVFADTEWNCYGDDCEYMYHRYEGDRGEANFNVHDDYDFLQSVEDERQHYNRLAAEMKKQFTKCGADDAAVAKAI